jgi:hypothetical protein
MQRFDIKLPATITWSDNKAKNNKIELSTSNICAGGAYFPTHRPLDVATPVTLDVILPFETDHNGNRRSVNINGSVVYTSCQGMAIAFDGNYRILNESSKMIHNKDQRFSNRKRMM